MAQRGANPGRMLVAQSSTSLFQRRFEQMMRSQNGSTAAVRRAIDSPKFAPLASCSFELCSPYGLGELYGRECREQDANPTVRWSADIAPGCCVVLCWGSRVSCRGGHHSSSKRRFEQKVRSRIGSTAAVRHSIGFAQIRAIRDL